MHGRLPRVPLAPPSLARSKYRQVGHDNPQRHHFISPAAGRSAVQSSAERCQLENDASEYILGDAPSARSDSETSREHGAMSRRLSELTEQSLADHGGREGAKLVEEAGFSDELKRSLEYKISQSTYRLDNASAHAEVNMPSAAGKGTRGIAVAQPWTGSEAAQDAVLRMLDDATPPLRGRNRSVSSTRASPLAGPRRQAKAHTSGQRLANARDRTSVYAFSKESSLSPAEREQMRKDLKERFAPTSRPMPTSIQGIASLANERIEDAIARGQFKNLPRGKVIERDYNASSPFLDTTEYFMNKIIQKQDIVPPWIEKQQELAKAVSVFRSRLRADWKRHSARVIASAGGSVQDQVRRAEQYAETERNANPANPPSETEVRPQTTGKALADSDEEAIRAPTVTTKAASSALTSTREDHHSSPPHAPLLPFRDPAYLATEYSYHTLSINTLNALTRTYNLMAPDLAKKPYFSLDRELKTCFADVAPLVAQEIRDRARAGVKRAEASGHRPGGVLERFAGSERVTVYDDRRKAYGFKDFWRDLWGQR